MCTITTTGGEGKAADNPKGSNPPKNTRRCHAHNRAGKLCGCPAVTGWAVCRFHGAGGGAPKGERNGNWKHGGHTREAEAVRRAATRLLREIANETE